jgi:hypothetical protein
MGEGLGDLYEPSLSGWRQWSSNRGTKVKQFLSGPPVVHMFHYAGNNPSHSILMGRSFWRLSGFREPSCNWRRQSHGCGHSAMTLQNPPGVNQAGFCSLVECLSRWELVYQKLRLVFCEPLPFLLRVLFEAFSRFSFAP